MRLEREATCIYCTSLKHPSKPVTLVILVFWFLALVVIDAPHCSVLKEAYNKSLPHAGFSMYGSLLFDP
jgi:hypothetical protein